MRLIGQMEAWTLSSENVLPSGRKTRALLAVAALSAPRPVLRGRVAELLWSRRPEEQARASLRQEVHRLLESLSAVGTDVLVVTRDHITLRPGAAWVDVAEVMRATVEDPASLALLDGDLLEDLDGLDPAFDMWLAIERERLRDRGRSLAEALLVSQDEPETAIPAAQQLLQIDRAHEGAWRALMKAYAARGERGMAIQAYERCRSVLADLLDASPSTETQKLLAEIRGPSGKRLPRRLPIPTADPEPASRAEPRLASFGRGGARVGVLPLTLVGVSEEDVHLAPGLAEEITTALSRFRWLFVVAATSLAQFAETRGVEVELRRIFDLDFVLDGTIQRIRQRLRISLRLLDLRNAGQVVWAHRFDRLANDLLSLQDEIAAEVVAQIDPEILLIEARRVTSRPATDSTAYDLVLRSLPLIVRLERNAFMAAGQYLSQAIAREPDYGAAHAWYAYWHMFLVGQSWAEDPDAAMIDAGLHAERAILLDPFDARGLTIAGHVRAYLHRRLREAAPLHDQALSLNPNLAMAWSLSAATYAYMGELAEAERRNKRYKRLSPLDPHAFFYDGIFTLIHLLKHEHETAITYGRQVTQLNPALSAGYKPYLAALGHEGRVQEAAVVRQRLLGIEPDFTIERFLTSSPIESPEHRAHCAEGLRLAGISQSDAKAGSSFVGYDAT